ncbi:anti-sigma factor antagonist [Actinoplanes sp. NPDC049316]|uniref:STAS domain-containing protein n=1 Tax=Actinoplanes sp. NPDC049316 TaxID=3154727 RepID=UPI0034297CF0
MDTTAKHAVADQFADETAVARDWLQVEVVARAGTPATLLRLTGELDATTAPELRSVVDEVLRGPAHRTVEIDTGGLGFLDSSGIRCLLVCRKKAEAAGGRLVLVDPSPCVRQVLEVTGLLDLFAVPPRLQPPPTIPGPRSEALPDRTHPFPSHQTPDTASDRAPRTIRDRMPTAAGDRSPAASGRPGHAPQPADHLIRQSVALREMARETRQRAEAMRADDAQRRSRIRNRPAQEDEAGASDQPA